MNAHLRRSRQVFPGKSRVVARHVLFPGKCGVSRFLSSRALFPEKCHVSFSPSPLSGQRNPYSLWLRVKVEKKRMSSKKNIKTSCRYSSAVLFVCLRSSEGLSPTRSFRENAECHVSFSSPLSRKMNISLYSFATFDSKRNTKGWVQLKVKMTTCQ